MMLAPPTTRGIDAMRFFAALSFEETRRASVLSSFSLRPLTASHFPYSTREAVRFSKTRCWSAADRDGVNESYSWESSAK